MTTTLDYLESAETSVADAIVLVIKREGDGVGCESVREQAKALDEQAGKLRDAIMEIVK